MGKILVIDDSQSIIHSLRMVLESAGLEVTSACNGVEGLRALQSGYRPNLILTDINMPVMNGYEFIRQARNVCKFTPILALTTESAMTSKEEAKTLGATGWIVKPFNPPSLLKAVGRFVDLQLAQA